MKERFDFVRIYDDENRVLPACRNIEFVVSSNFFKKLTEILKLSNREYYTESKHQDGRMVICPRNYEEFKKLLSQTKVDEFLKDINVVYQEKAPLLVQNLDGDSVTLYYNRELFTEGYNTLLEYVKELLYDGKERDEKTEKHLKRTFINESNKIHKELIAAHMDKITQKQR